MATRLVHVVIDAQDPSGLARFWAAALGWEVDADDSDEADVSPPGFEYPGPEALPLVFIRVPDPKIVKNRIHLDLASQSAAHQRELVGRLRDLGAVPADVAQSDVPWVVLADPEGNEFCVVEPRAIYQDTGPVAAIVVDTVAPAGVADFWTVAGGWRIHDNGNGVVSLRSPQDAGPYLEFLPSADPRRVKNRVHLDVAPGKEEDAAAAVESLLRVGAVRADVGQGAVTWTVLADPEGNEFCVLSPR
jgi:catechol 2,3-dioxygenase-like lactoylglutathione lyase family enzyme